MILPALYTHGSEYKSSPDFLILPIPLQFSFCVPYVAVRGIELDPA